MPTFSYKAKITPGRIIKGTLEAKDMDFAAAELTRKGIFPIEIKPQSFLSGDNLSYGGPLPDKDIYLFSHQLSGLLNSGLDLMAALVVISGQAQNKRFKKIVSGLLSGIKGGKSFSSALSDCHLAFPGFYRAMIAASENSGTLEETLGRLAEYFAKRAELKSAVIDALLYPLFVMAVGIFTIWALLGFVLPRLSVIFLDMGRELPLPTRIIMALSGFLSGNSIVIVVLLLVSPVIFYIIFGRAKSLVFFDRLKLRLPAFGPIIKKIELANFCRALAGLLGGGVSLVKALGISKEVIGNAVMKADAELVLSDVNGGMEFTASLKNRKYFPDYMINIIMVGESGGELEKPLLQIAKDYSFEADRALKTAVKLLEPVTILIVGVVAAFIVFSVLLPVFQMDLVAN